MNEIDKLIEEQFLKLPKELQLSINAVPWKSLVKEIAYLNNLSIDQVTILEKETMLILYGFENPDDYITNIVREIGIDETLATTIAEEVNERILKAIELNAEEMEKEASENHTQTGVSVPEIAPNNLPMVEGGEKAHDVPHIDHPTSPPMPPKPAVKPEAKPEAKPELPKASLPDYRYPGGKDPYREPLK